MRQVIRNVLRYLNPIARLGNRNYSFLIPLIVTVVVYLLSELFVKLVVGDPEAVGGYIIFISAAIVMFFSFRDGTIGGYTTVVVTIAYFIYIILSQPRFTDTAQRSTALETTMVLGLMFFVLAFVIGWLKEKIDRLIEAEANEKQRLRTIIRQLPVGILITDREGRVVESNSKVEEMIDRKIPKGFQIGQEKLLDAFTADGKPSQPKRTPLARALTEGESVIGEEYVIPHSDGSHIHLQVSASPIHNKRGKIIAAAEILTDITQQKQIEEMKDDFLSIASHELKTPLTTIKGYTQVLERSLADSKDVRTQKYLEKTVRYIDRLADLIEDLLDVSRIQGGKLDFNYNEYDFNKMVAETIQGFQEMNPQIKIMRKGKVPQKIFGDSSRTEQVLTNFLSNAIKYSPGKNKVVVHIKPDSKKVTVGVQDFGIGIAPDQIEKLFTRFYRVEGVAEKFSGLGIGLYISAEIIQRQGGKLWVESTPGKGSTFYFTLPIKAKRIRS